MPRVGSTEISPQPLAWLFSSSMLVTAPAWRTMATSVASPAARFAWTVMGDARSGVRVSSLVATNASTVGAAASAPASTASCESRLRSAATIERSCTVESDSSRSGDSASASGITTLTPIAAASARLMVFTRRASWVRGHGHWPMAARLFWSISTTVTGRTLTWRGEIDW
jgi:hypothetical protein